MTQEELVSWKWSGDKVSVSGLNPISKRYDVHHIHTIYDDTGDHELYHIPPPHQLQGFIVNATTYIEMLSTVVKPCIKRVAVWVLARLCSFSSDSGIAEEFSQLCGLLALLVWISLTTMSGESLRLRSATDIIDVMFNKNENYLIQAHNCFGSCIEVIFEVKCTFME